VLVTRKKKGEPDALININGFEVFQFRSTSGGKGRKRVGKGGVRQSGSRVYLHTKEGEKECKNGTFGFNLSGL